MENFQDRGVWIRIRSDIDPARGSTMNQLLIQEELHLIEIPIYILLTLTPLKMEGQLTIFNLISFFQYAYFIFNLFSM